MIARARRTGAALIVALALLALGSALLAGGAAAARSATRGQETLEASLAAEAEARVVMAETLAQWSAAYDSVALGTSTIAVVGPRRQGFGGSAVRSLVRILRVGASRYVVAVSTEVGPSLMPRARRRIRLVLERRAPADSTMPILPPAPIARWSLADLF